MPLLETKGAASAQGFGEFAKVGAANYIEDVFSTWLYTGNDSTNTITNGIDLSTKGGLVWGKLRQSADNNWLIDTVRGNTKKLVSNSTAAETTPGPPPFISSFNTNGFTLDGTNPENNSSGYTYASWTFRKQPKFFDVVTYTGTGANRTVAHSLGSVPGCIIVKRTDTAGTAWVVYHTSLGNTKYLTLQTTNGETTASNIWNNTSPTSTVFTVGTNNAVNANGGTYVAYLFAHDAGGFGLTGSDNVISCGSFTSDGSRNASVTLGYEPQWVMVKSAGDVDNWRIFDNMRGLTAGGTNEPILYPNLSNAENTDAGFNEVRPNATGFTTVTGSASITYIYIAIRRGPMKTPTDATKVFTPTVYTGTNVDNRLVDTTIAPDMVWVRQRNDTVLGGMVVGDRLRAQPYLLTGSTAAEVDDADAFDKQLVSTTEYGTAFSSMTGFWCGNDATAKLNANTASDNHVAEAFKRAPGFFDEVCYTGTGGTGSRSLTHNLGAAPEFIILKRRDSTGNWATGSMFTSTTVTRALLNRNDDQDLNSLYSGQSIWGGQPTSSAFLVDASGAYNTSAATYVAYLFATVAGVSKVGTYTGTGALQTVNCGFTGGARFVLIRRANATGDWFVYDSARGISSGNDPYLLLNSTAAEVTGTNYVDTTSVGFQVTAAAPAGLNASGSTYIFLAIA